MVELSEDNTTINKKEDSEIKNQKSLYTQEERDSFVRAFIEAWRTHRVYPDYSRFSPTIRKPFSFDDMDKEPPPPTVANITSAPALRNLIEKKIGIASGSTPAPSEMIQITINDLYNDIIAMQGRHYLAGEFLDNTVEERIFEKLKKILDQHVEKIRNELGLDEI